jgi:hypothetical protein
MILRRVVDHLKLQHWTAIGIELVIVILGVFVGMQVSNWNDERHLAQKRVTAIARMHAESERNVAYLANRMDVLTRDADLRSEALRRLSAGDWQGADLAKMADALDSLGLVPALSPPRGVYDELISTGMFAELGGPRLRDAISDYFAYLAFAEKQIEFVRSAVVAASTRQQFPGMRNVFDAQAPRQRRAVYDFAALAADRAFVEWAVEGNSDRLAQAKWTTIALEKARAVCAELSLVDGLPCHASPEVTKP